MVQKIIIHDLDNLSMIWKWQRLAMSWLLGSKYDCDFLYVCVLWHMLQSPLESIVAKSVPCCDKAINKSSNLFLTRRIKANNQYSCNAPHIGHVSKLKWDWLTSVVNNQKHSAVVFLQNCEQGHPCVHYSLNDFFSSDHSSSEAMRVLNV